MSRPFATFLASLALAGCYLGPLDSTPASHRSPQPTPVCGDARCEGAEGCASCPGDCGACATSWDVDLGAGAVEVTGSTRGRVDAVGVACGDGGSGPDLSYRWVAPAAGTYFVSLLDANFEALLDVRAETSTGRELACVDLSTGGDTLALTLGARQAVVIVVDGRRGASGSFRLAITEGAPATFCGDRFCDAGESCSSCPADCGACGWCGDGTCDWSENAWSCAADCATRAVCGDRVCEGDEDGWSCPEDCDVCEGSCGDGFCGGGEDDWSCAYDCAPGCGDGTCDYDEDAWSCATDCTGFCGDAFCDPVESGTSCPADCAPACGDGYCDRGEDVWNCAWDCGVLCPG